VPGDVLILLPGMLVPADARLIEGRDLLVDESTLTGESVPVAKATAPVARRDAPLAERTNLVFRGTAVTGGSGVAVVVATGGATEIGRIGALVAETRAPETPMQRQLEHMGRELAVASLGLCGVFFALGLWRGFNFLTLLKSTAALAVAAVPEGLPTTATTTLALGLRDMRRRNVLARRIDAIETLGAVNVICFDKTGTLTLNKMSVAAIVTADRRVEVTNGRFEAAGTAVIPDDDDVLRHMLRVAALCSDVEVNGSGSAYALKGSPTETALVEACIAAGIDVAALRRQYPVEARDYRAEARRFMRSVHTGSGGRKFVAVKGSPPEVLNLCAAYARNGGRQPINEELRAQVMRENDVMAGRALRVLGLAYADDAADAEQASLVWLGLVGMRDPIRPGTRAVMESFQQAGIKTVMITGDQSATAYAVARELDLARGRPIEILDGLDVSRTDPMLMAALAERTDAYARISPANKLEIVRALQQAGLVVAMTGDGINDSPALRAADIGIAMGEYGTDAAKEVADIVLEDDNLNSMVAAIAQGRTTSRNIRKATHYLLATNSSELFLMLAAVAIGLPAPLHPMQLLWINLVSEVAPALALALEPDEPDVMHVPPRKADARIIAGEDFARFIGEGAVLGGTSLGAYLYGVRRYGAGPQANTLAFSSLVMSQILHARACRSERYGLFQPGALPRNRHLDWAVNGLLAIQGIATLIPGMRSLLGMTALGAADAAVGLVAGAAPLFVNEAIKAARQAGVERRGALDRTGK
jgi:Ca2+-transporting ATPase